MVHINAMVVWMLYGFIGSVYWFLEDESGVQIVGLKWGQLAFWVLTGAVTLVVLVYLFIQFGAGNDTSLWLINEGREYIEAPRWADIGIVVVVLTFFYNVAATFAKGQWSGIAGVLVLDLVALAGLYLAGMFYVTNISVDQYWWWWVIHLWVEATWEVLVGCIMAWSLMKLLGVRRQIVQTWLYIEVALMFGSGILGLGHHYFWIGTPEYWFSIGGFFSALEPIPLVAMVVHSVYDSGVHRFKNSNHPALAWIIAHTFGNFLGAGVGVSCIPCRKSICTPTARNGRPRTAIWPSSAPTPPSTSPSFIWRRNKRAAMSGWAATWQRLALESRGDFIECRRLGHDRSLADRRLRAILHRACRRRLDLGRLLRRAKPPLVYASHGLAHGIRLDDRGRRWLAVLGFAGHRQRRTTARRRDRQRNRIID